MKALQRSMRTIGKKNKSLVQKETLKELKKKPKNYFEVEGNVCFNLPIELWDTWKGADAEIRCLISDIVDEEIEKGFKFDQSL